MELSENTSDTAADLCYTSKLPDPYANLLLSTNLLPNCTTTQYRLDCSVWLDPLHYLRVSLPPQDILPYLGPGAESFGGLLFWSVMEHSQSGCVNHDTAIIKSSLGHSEATQDIKTADATLQELQHEEVATTQDEHQPSAMTIIVNALVAIVALFLALFGFGISNGPTEENSQNAAAMKKVLLQRKKAEKRIKRAEAHMRALDRLVEAQQLDIGDNGTGSWEMLER